MSASAKKKPVVLIIASRDKRDRYRFIAHPLDSVDLPWSLFQFYGNYLKNIFLSLWYPFTHPKPDTIIIQGGNLTFFIWVVIGRLWRTRILLRVGGDTIGILGRKVRSLYAQKRTLQGFTLATNLVLTRFVFKNIDTLVTVNGALYPCYKDAIKPHTPVFEIPQPYLGATLRKKDTFSRGPLSILAVTSFANENKCRPILTCARWLMSAPEKYSRFTILGGGFLMDSALSNFGIDLPAARQKNIFFEGFVSDVSDYMERADLLLYASGSDGLPNVILEGMAFGLPILINTDPVFNRLLENEQDAIFFDLENRADFFSRIDRLTHEPSLRERLRENGYRKLRETYSCPAVGALWHDVLSHLAFATPLNTTPVNFSG